MSVITKSPTSHIPVKTTLNAAWCIMVLKLSVSVLSYMDCHGLEVLVSLRHNVTKPEDWTVWIGLTAKHTLGQVGAVDVGQDVPSALKNKQQQKKQGNI